MPSQETFEHTVLLVTAPEDVAWRKHPDLNPARRTHGQGHSVVVLVVVFFARRRAARCGCIL